MADPDSSVGGAESESNPVLTEVAMEPDDKPSDYIMGKFQESKPGSGDWYIISGGHPKADWSGIDPSKPVSTYVPTQKRIYGSKHESAEYAKRVKPMETVFKEGMSLRELKESLLDHAEEHGLDTWMYLQDPYMEDRMVNVVSEYARFLAAPDETVERARILSTGSYDDFDRENSKALATFLFKSLDKTLQSHLKLMCEEGDISNFICVWTRLLAKVATVSSSFYDDLKAKVKACLPNQFAQENIEEWYKALLPNIELLINGDMYDHALTESILSNLVSYCSAGGVFALEAAQALSMVKKEVTKVKFMRPDAADGHMTKRKLDVRTLLRQFVQLYVDEKRESRWLPGRGPTDSRAPGGANLAMMAAPDTVALISEKVIATLQHTGMTNGEGRPNAKLANMTCYNCGEKGHMARDCPKPRRERGDRGSGNRSRRDDGGNRGNHERGQGGGAGSTSNNSRDKNVHWRRDPPADGASETMRRGGNTFYWCGKCRHWNKTHVTSAHVRRPVGNAAAHSGGGSADRVAAANLALDPSAWMVTAVTDEDDSRETDDGDDSREPAFDLSECPDCDEITGDGVPCRCALEAIVSDAHISLACAPVAQLASADQETDLSSYPPLCIPTSFWPSDDAPCLVRGVSNSSLRYCMGLHGQAFASYIHCLDYYNPDASALLVAFRDRLQAQFGNVSGGAHVVVAHDRPPDPVWFTIAIPFVYVAVLFLVLPSVGVNRTACLLGLTRSLDSIMSHCVGPFTAVGSAICSCLGLGPALATSFYSVVLEQVFLVWTGWCSLPWSAYFAPALWSFLFGVLSIGPSKVSGSRPHAVPRHVRRAQAQANKRFRRKFGRWWLRMFPAPRLRGRHFHRPHHKPRSMAPLVRQRAAQSNQVDVAATNRQKAAAKLKLRIKAARQSYKTAMRRLATHPTSEGRFRVQECFIELCKLRRRQWCQNGRQGREPPRAPRRTVKRVVDRAGQERFMMIGHVKRIGMCTKNTSAIKETMRGDTDNSFPIIWDSGASVCITPERGDFVEFDTKTDLQALKGFSSTDKGQQVKGVGEVSWSIIDTSGRSRSLRVKAYYVPSSRVRLLSVTCLLSAYPGESVNMDSKGLTLSGVKGDKNRGQVFAPINVSSQLPVSIGRRGHDVSGVNVAVPVVSAGNTNLAPAEKELLRWHQRLGHLAYKKVQYLMKTGVLAHSEATRRLHRIACRTGAVKCAACQFAKQRARSAPGTVSRLIESRQGVLSQGNLQPGQEVCVDHFICANKGRLFTSRGATKEGDMFSGGAIFVDQASGFVHVEPQTSMTSHSTLRAKESYEAMCRDVGVIPQKYLSDNGTAFTSKEYQSHLMEFKQVQRFAGVGAHHHNARAERSIQTIMSISRAMMMHCFLHWPDMEDTSLWPMAVNHAVYLWNHVPDPATGLCPADVFTKTKFQPSKLLDLHVFGCPVYVLDKALADGKKIPRWKPRSTRCMYLGRSSSHASTVPIVLNPETGTITPQFHVVFDDWFATVNSTVEDLPDFNSPEWQKMFGESTYQYVLDDADVDALNQLSVDLENEYDSTNAEFARNRVLEAAEQLRPTLPLAPPSFSAAPRPAAPPAATWGEIVRERASASGVPEPTIPVSNAPAQSPPQPRGDVVSPQPRPESDHAEGSGRITKGSAEDHSKAEVSVGDSKGSEELNSGGNSSALKIEKPKPPAPKPEPPRRSTRARSKPDRLDPSGHLASPLDVHFGSLLSAFNCPISINAARGKNNPDLFTYDEAMRSEHKEKWIESAIKEISELEQHGGWIEVPIPKGVQVVPAQWVFRLKRKPDGSVSKFKGRIVLRGDLMKDIYDKTSPVVAFSTVRLFLAMSLFLNWYTCSVDFANAFIQATRPDEVYMQIPRGFRSKPGYCLKLVKNIYGAADGPKLWAELLFKSLRTLGFKQSKIDPCLWYKPDCFIICFVDDCGICCKHEEDCDKLIEELKDLGFSLTKESSFEEFLGIQYETLPNGDVDLTQKGLISKIIQATGLENCNPNRVPATTQLAKDPDGESMTDDWSYPSVIGMLLYLTTNTRPDITFAVSQAARFTHDPKQSHASAVKTIVRYLAKTRDKGMIVKRPSSELKLDCYVDADFAGLYKAEKDESLDSAKSRSGYIIKLGGCPIVSKSQLIPTICLSTAESEYYSLSQSMRALLPIQSLITEFMQTVDVPRALRNVGQKVHATAHEDNTSALSLATEQRLTSRTRHYHCRWHFFWQKVQDGSVEVIYCDTAEQEADYLTKPLVHDKFVANRKRVQGW